MGYKGGHLMKEIRGLCCDFKVGFHLASRVSVLWHVSVMRRSGLGPSIPPPFSSPGTMTFNKI